jgi:hypothetical protein
LKEYYQLGSRISSLIKTRGISFTISYLKKVRLAILKSFCNSTDRVPEIGYNGYGLPKILGPSLSQAIKERSPSDLRLINTLLYCTRGLKLGKIVDVSTITDAPKEYSSVYGKHLQSF